MSRLRKFCGLVLIGALVALVAWGMHPIHGINGSKCRGQLRLVGDAYRVYVGGNDGHLPTLLAGMSNELASPAFVKCPATKTPIGAFTHCDAWSDYVLVDWSRARGTNPPPADFPICYDRRMSNHAGRGVNVVTANGLVKWDANAEWLNSFAKEHPEANFQMPE